MLSLHIMRSFRNILLAALALALASCSQKADFVTMLVGTYSTPESNGIYACRFDQENGRADTSFIGNIALPEASYLTLNEATSTIYAVSEMDSASSYVSALSFNKEYLSFRNMGKAATEGSPCYVSTNGGIVVTANYGGGSLSTFRIGEEGTLYDTIPCQHIIGHIGGPDSTRQNQPHIHCVIFSPDGKFLLASDFSADQILSFKVEGDSLIEYAATKLNPDYGPRHIIFKGGDRAYVIGELSGDITICEYADGRLTPMQVVENDPANARGSADIRITPDGRFLYASNRLKNDGVGIYRIEPDGKLSSVGYQVTGTHPRNICVTPNGKFLLVACRDTNEIEIYKINSKTGLLNDTGNRVHLPKPVCVVFD
jgi:6-phosphogluconolactonase